METLLLLLFLLLPLLPPLCLPPCSRMPRTGLHVEGRGAASAAGTRLPAEAAAMTDRSTSLRGPPILSSSSSPAPAPRTTMPRPSSYQWLSFAEMPNITESNGNGNEDDRLPLGASSSSAAGASGGGASGGGAPNSSSSGGFAGFTARQVEEVRMVVRMLPVFWTTAFYWAIYAQMGSFFVEQGQFMDRRIFFSTGSNSSSNDPSIIAKIPSTKTSPGSHHQLGRPFEVPAASLALFNTVAIIALVPLYDRGLLPLLKVCGRRGPTLLQRIGWGLVVCALAMAAAAGVEQARLYKVATGQIVDDDGRRHRGGDVASLSVFWQVPQYLLVGASEVLASIGQLEFFYDQAPDVMRSCSMALQLLSVAVGSYLSGALVAAVGAGTAWLGPGKDGAGWLPSALNEGRLDLFFWLMAALCVANTLLFLVVASRYQYKDVPHGRRRKRAPEEVVVAGEGEPQQQQATTPTTLPRPGRAPPTAARGIGGGSFGRSRGPMGGASSPADSAFGRSVTYVPPSPALPAPFR